MLAGPECSFLRPLCPCCGKPLAAATLGALFVRVSSWTSVSSVVLERLAASLDTDYSALTTFVLYFLASSSMFCTSKRSSLITFFTPNVNMITTPLYLKVSVQASVLVFLHCQHRNFADATQFLFWLIVLRSERQPRACDELLPLFLLTEQKMPRFCN